MTQKAICLVRVALVAMITAVCCRALPDNVTFAEENKTRVENPVPDATASAAEEYQRVVLPILERYCFGCHAEGANEGDLSLDEFPSVKAMTTDTQTWSSVLKNVRSDVMPPELAHVG